MILSIILFIIITVLIHYNKKYESMANHYLSGIDVVYWINLDRAPDRKNEMEKMFQDKCFEGIPKERIRAFDAKMNPTMVLNHLVIETKKH
jgi:hypothetical protein